MGSTKLLLRFENVAVLILSLYVYGMYGFSWLTFFILLFVPDLSMIGYVWKEKVGAWIYNIFHTYILSFAMLFVGYWLHSNVVFLIGIIWTAHIAVDRVLGYGLKYPTHFKDTHLSGIEH